MTTLKHIELTCPVCSTQFSSQAVASTNSFGGKRTDFHGRAAGAQPLQYYVHLCSRCGYAGSERDFGEEAEVSPALKERVWDELAPRLADATTLGRTHDTGNTTEGAAAVAIAGSEKYEFAAKVANWQGADARRMGELLLKAAWCCVDEEDTEAERYFRRYAAWAFERARDDLDRLSLVERAVFTYLVGELWRRVGDETRARVWFGRVEDEVINRCKQQWVIDAAIQQRDDPREWFG
jgi:uncharacterized protein (DUF2225 family)